MNVTLPTTLQMLLGLYGYLLPVLLYVLWSTLALWDLSRRESLGAGAVVLWSLLIYLIPFIGAAAYLIAGGSRIAARSKWIALGGGAATYLILLAIGAGIGGIA